MMRDMEMNMHRDKLEKEKRFINQQEVQNKVRKKQDENDYYQTLAMQAKEKQHKLLQEKETDKQFSIAETKKLNNEEKARNQFFDKLKRIQNENDQKHKMLMKYMAQDPASLNSKKDEQSYIKSLAIGEKKAVQKDFLSKRNKDMTVQRNNEELDKQLQEKMLVKMTEKEQQALLAKQYQNEVNKLKLEEDANYAKMKQRQADYYKDLNSQLKEKNKKKQYSILMSEYERSVNDNDIKAYQKADTSGLAAKVPGYNSFNPQEKYIDKAMNISGEAAYDASPKRVGGQPRKNKLQNAALQSFENFGDGKGISLVYHEDNINPNKLERVRQNMEKEDAIKYRANTNNKGYGFEQVLGSQSVPSTIQKTVTKLDDSSPYEYNFRAPGNY